MSFARLFSLVVGLPILTLFASELLAAAEPPTERPGQKSVAPDKGPPTTAQLVDRILRLLDKDKDGKISRAEAKGSPLEAVFDRIDRNHDGFLDREELMRGRGVMARPANAAPADTRPTPTPSDRPVPTPSTTPAPDTSSTKAPDLPPGMREVLHDQVRAFIQKYDRNADGKIDMAEFQDVFRDVDRNHDGKVDKDELHAAAERLFMSMSPPAPASTTPAPRHEPAPLPQTPTDASRSAPTSPAPAVKPNAPPAPKEIKVTPLNIMILHLIRRYRLKQDGYLGWAEAQAIFRHMDRNHDGALDANEILQGLLELWAPQQTTAVPAAAQPKEQPAPRLSRLAQPDADALAVALLQRYDRNRDGGIDIVEWRALFEQLDRDQTGRLDRAKLRRLFAQLLAGSTASAETREVGPEGRVSFVLSMYDTDHDGQISLKEAANTPLATLFQQIDRDGDGYLSRTELLRAARLLPIPAAQTPSAAGLKSKRPNTATTPPR